ncbi:hypothetical protein BY996DRAFT_1206699 [Phakopsora pachyrhizi]|uniref:Expressed protein n=1 Tax=Phakopsora pachyrhizi TaxID=170000 RepID=A0AAV0AS08_PHAPC|nr:hypothetical protein BY996DRAFT_1206699 [Phakopsora pachyrhizi]CAH7671232.1 expressed protein [Phakopsora pachyrhizi]
MGPIYFIDKLKSPVLSIMLLSGLFFPGYLSTLDSLKPSSLASKSCDFSLISPQHKGGELMHTSLYEGAHEIQRSQSSTQELVAGASKFRNFDLNEFPMEMEVEANHDQKEKISRLGSERNYSWRGTSKRQKLDPIENTLNLVTLPSSSISHSVDFSSPYVNSKKTHVNVDFENEFNYHHVYKNQQTDIVNQNNECKDLAILKSSMINSESRFSGQSKQGSTKGNSCNENYIAIKSNKENKSDKLNSGISVLVANKSSASEEKYKSNLKKEPKSKVRPYFILNAPEFIKNILSNEIKNHGPFYIEGVKDYCSPYNRDLLNFIEDNFENILPEVLSDFKITKKFLAKIKFLFWNENEGIFFVPEKSINLVIKTMEDFSQSAGVGKWVKYSEKSSKYHTKASSAVCFAFDMVFINYYTYENFSRFFFTKSMRQSGVIFFELLEQRLLNSSTRLRITKTKINAILRQVWNRMTSFMAYVHAINAIISPGLLEPLTHEQLVQRQEEAFEFFIELHQDFEKLYKKSTEKRGKINLYNITFDGPSFEEIRQQVMGEILNNYTSRDIAVWLYIELYMIKFRPKLFYIAKKIPGNEKKFKSILNRMFLIFFSGMDKNEKLRSNTKIESIESTKIK